MDGALTVKNIDYGKVNLHIKKSGGDKSTYDNNGTFSLHGEKNVLSFPNFSSKL